MPRTSHTPKDTSFNFRIDPALKAAFTRATEAEDKPAAQVIRDFMRTYVKVQERRAFAAQARRDSAIVNQAAHDPESDDAQVMREIDAETDDPSFFEDWHA